MDKTCVHCNSLLKYVAEIAAPGKGQSWVCSNTNCGIGYWVNGMVVVPWSAVDPEDTQLTISDVI